MLVTKTGTAAGVRADVGFVGTAEGALVCCVIANWPDELDITDAVMGDMWSIGELVRGMC